jgi:hypothetical protein
MSRGTTIAVLSALALVVAAPAAEAKGKKKPKLTPVLTRTGSATTSADGQSASAVATCPKGTIALGGGFNAPFARSGNDIVDFNVVHESRRMGRRTWAVIAVRQDGETAGPALSVTATVHCRNPLLGKRRNVRKPKRLVVTAVPVTGQTGGNNVVLTATAACPPGLRLLGGGFRISPAPVLTGVESFARPSQSTPTGSFSWQASATNIGAVGRATTSYAYCITRRVPIFTRATGELAGGDGIRPEATVNAQVCPGKRQLVGGGFSHPHTPSFRPIPSVSAAVGGEWRATAWNPGTEPGTLSSTGICL